jgi:hypothetical protein
MAYSYEGNSFELWYAEACAKGWTYQQPAWATLEDGIHMNPTSA